MDPISTAALASAAKTTDAAGAESVKVASNLIQRLFGPTADVLGEHWADRMREKNLARLLKKTEKRAEQDGKTGTAPPRVAAHAFETAQYADDELVAEYLSGVLASSRTEAGKNDAGISWSALISRLSADQLRLHYLIYANAREALAVVAEGNANQLHGLSILLPLKEVVERFGDTDFFTRFPDAIDGLMRENLIGDGYAYGAPATIIRDYPEGSTLNIPFPRALQVSVTIHGIRLFLWGLGEGHQQINVYLDFLTALAPIDEQSDLAPIPGVQMMKGSVLDHLGVPLSY